MVRRRDRGDAERYTRFWFCVCGRARPTLWCLAAAEGDNRPPSEDDIEEDSDEDADEMDETAPPVGTADESGDAVSSPTLSVEMPRTASGTDGFDEAASALLSIRISRFISSRNLYRFS